MVEFRFYKAFMGRKTTFVDKFIAAVTFSKYSHVEIIDENGVTIRVSSMTNSVNIVEGVRYNEDRWDTIVVDDIDGLVFTEYIRNSYEGKKYDYFGAIFSAVPFFNWFCSNDKLFCSEAAAMALGYRHPCRYSPGRIYRRLTK